MDKERDRLKHLLVILLEALSTSADEASASRSRIQDRVVAAGLDEEDVHGLLDWIETQWHADGSQSLPREPVPEAPSSQAFRVFNDADWGYVSADAVGFLVEMQNAGQITRAQMEALLQYASYIAIKPLEREDLETVIEQVLFRTHSPGLTGGASEGYESTH